MGTNHMFTKRLLIMLALSLLSCVLFLTIGAKGNWDFILWFRGVKLISIILVAVSVSVATILFQTISQNRILTPSIMGFDSLYILVQTSIIFILGGFAFSSISAEVKFFLNFLVMLVAALALFGTLLGKTRQDIHRLLLTGIIFGVLFTSITSFLQRMIDPSEFAIVVSASFAQFNRINSPLLLLICSGLVSACMLTVWYYRHHLDVMALGRDASINLGLNYQKFLIVMLIIIATLVSASTALVGPITFFGLLVSNLTYQLIPTHRHAILIPATALISVVILIGGQTILERILNLSTPLSVIIEFLGGITFLVILLRGSKK